MPANEPPSVAAAYELVPMAHVVHAEASIRFYELLGFQARDRLTHVGRTRWAWLSAGKAHLMLAAASGAIDAGVQAVSFYLYTRDLAVLRTQLLAQGLSEGGKFSGTPSDPRRVVFEIAHPPYTAEGEKRVVDPDGYCLLIGKCEVKT